MFSQLNKTISISLFTGSSIIFIAFFSSVKKRYSFQTGQHNLGNLFIFFSQKKAQFMLKAKFIINFCFTNFIFHKLINKSSFDVSFIIERVLHISRFSNLYF